MPYLCLVLSTVFIASSGILVKFYNNGTKEIKGGASFYNLLLSASIFLSWTVFLIIDFSFEPRVVLYSIVFFVFFTATFLSQIKAIQSGPMSLTSLVLQFSLIGVTIYGIVFGWPNAKLNILIIVGLILVALSLFLCLYEGKQNTSDRIKLNKKWFFYAGIMFVSNAGCTIIQKEQQMAFEAQHGNLFMAAATFLFFLVSLVLYIRSDRSEVKRCVKLSALPIIAGVFNFGLNLFMIILARQTVISPSALYPIIAVGGLGLSTVFATLIFKEKLSIWQWIGVALGAVAIAILNI